MHILTKLTPWVYVAYVVCAFAAQVAFNLGPSVASGLKAALDNAGSDSESEFDDGTSISLTHPRQAVKTKIKSHEWNESDEGGSSDGSDDGNDSSGSEAVSDEEEDSDNDDEGGDSGSESDREGKGVFDF